MSRVVCHPPPPDPPNISPPTNTFLKQISKHYTRILTKWPVDRLRPDVSFQKILRARVAAAPSPKISDANTAQAEVPTSANSHSPATELREINALYSLLENRYSQEYPVSAKMMSPTSSPNHYTDLAKELDELPTRSRFGHFVKRLSNMVRWQ